MYRLCYTHVIWSRYSKEQLKAEGKWLAKAVPSHGVRMLRVSLAV